MKEKLEAAAEAHQQAMADLKKQIEEQKKAGNLAKAGELQQKLDQLQKQQPAMDRLQQLAQQMAQAQQGLQNGDGKKAADAMAKWRKQLAQMQKDMDQMKALDAMMDQMEMAKDAMVCKNCNGKGCEECQGNMFAMNGGKNIIRTASPAKEWGRARASAIARKNAATRTRAKPKCTKTRAAAPPRSAASSKARTSRATWPRASKKKWPSAPPSRPIRSRAIVCPTAAASRPSNISRRSAKANNGTDILPYVFRGKSVAILGSRSLLPISELEKALVDTPR